VSIQTSLQNLEKIYNTDMNVKKKEHDSGIADIHRLNIGELD